MREPVTLLKKLKPILLSAAASVLFALPLTAQTIGVFTLSGDDVPLHLVRVSEELLLSEARKLTGGPIIGSDELARRIREAGGDADSLSRCTDPACAAEAARLSGTDAIILAEISGEGGGFGLSLTAVGWDGRVIGSSEETVYDIRDLDEQVAAAGTALAVQAGLIEAPVAVAVAEESPSDGEPEKDAEAEISEAEAAAGAGQEAAGEPEEETGREDEPEVLLGGSSVTELSASVAQDSRRHAAFSAALVTLQLGGLGNLLTLHTDTEATTSYYQYLGSTDQTDIDRYYEDYQFYHSAARIAGVSAWSFSLAAPGLASWALFGGAPDELALSRRGRHYLYAGLGSALAGNLLYLGAMDSLVESSYLNARGENDDDPISGYYSDEYDRVHGKALVLEAAVIGLWTLGSAAIIASPLQEGKRRALAPNFWDKVLMGSGVLFFSGGNLMASMAGFRRTDAEEAYYKYLRADDNIQARYSAVEDEFDSYYLAGGLAAGFWLTGAACFAVAELFDFPDPFGSRKAAGNGSTGFMSSLRVLPLPDGGAVYVHLEL